MSYSTKNRICKRDKRVVQGISRIKLKYRDISGKGNNKEHPEWGSDNQQLLRKAPAAYADGLNQPAGINRPSAREISDVIFSQDKPTQNPQGASDMFWLIGQYVDHDIDLTPEADPTEPFPIPVPKGDPYFDPTGQGNVTIPFNRSTYDKDTGLTTPREQLNIITSFLDASNIYGSSSQREKYCRKYKDGEMAYSMGHMLPYNDGTMENAGGLSQKFYVAGDVRANEQLSLTAMHTLWMREHNYWAKLLKKYNKCWDDEKIFQTAKVIVEAEQQVITYREFLPLLLGHKFSKYRGYDDTINPGISNEFSTAAYRFGHSMVSGEFKRLKENGDDIYYGNINLKNAFFSPWILTNQEGIDPLLRGFAASLAEKLDSKVINDLRNFLFGEPGEGGLDLVSLNIQRGRDHGLADYNTTREAYNLDKVSSFAEITKNKNLQDKLEQLYGNVDNIDLWVGILCEDPYRYSMIGKLGYTIIKDQFRRMRDGDRFWYQNRLPRKLTRLLKRTKLRDVILRNTDIEHIQKYTLLYEKR